MPYARTTAQTTDSVGGAPGQQPQAGQKFNLSAQDWTEIYNALDDEDGVLAKLEEETTANNDLILTDAEWLEIYLAMEGRYAGLKSRKFGYDRTAKDWLEHVKDIIVTLDPIREKCIGGKAVTK